MHKDARIMKIMSLFKVEMVHIYHTIVSFQVSFCTYYIYHMLSTKYMYSHFSFLDGGSFLWVQK